jgi:hypothetical protein
LTDETSPHQVISSIETKSPMNLAKIHQPIAALMGVVLTFSAKAQDPVVTDEQIKNIEAALPAAAIEKPAKPRKLLVFSKTNGFRHKSIPVGRKAIEMMGKKTGAFEVTLSEDRNDFEPEKLAAYDGVLMLNTTQNVLNDYRKDDAVKITPEIKTADDAKAERLKKSLFDFIKSGKGLAGIHAATDTMYESEEYGSLIGGYFDGHPWNAQDTVTVKVRDTEHPLNAPFKAGGDKFDITDEIYQIKQWNPANQHTLLGLYIGEGTKTDMTKKGIKDTGGDYPIAWIRNYDQGRVFYCSLGHNDFIYWDKKVMEHFLRGIQFALGDFKVTINPGSTKP